MSGIIANAVIIVIIAAAVIGISLYLYRAKKRGETCIGCPYAKQCGGKACGGSQDTTIHKV